MADTVYETSDTLFVDLLNIACADFGDNTYGNDAHPGFAAYRVETHCVAVTYIAKVLHRDYNGTPARYVVIGAEHTQR